MKRATPAALPPYWLGIQTRAPIDNQPLRELQMHCADVDIDKSSRKYGRGNNSLDQDGFDGDLRIDTGVMTAGGGGGTARGGIDED